MRPRLGSLCTGYGGIEQGLALAGLDFELAFVADPDPAALKVLATRHPNVPNFGDITTAVDWTRLPRVDILTAGYPCQGESLAGKRRGITDERWIWNDVFAAIRDLRPRIVLLENVAGHLSLGFGRVLGDLASIGFDARWVCVRASDVGAAHRRERVFIHAYPADSESLGHGDGWTPSGQGIPPAPVANGDRALVPTPGARLGKCTSITPAAAARRLTEQGKHNLDDWAALLPTPTAVDGNLMLPAAVQPGRWGKYATAIERWEYVTSRPSPEPTEPRADRAAVRLAPRFVEWLMGLPAGWVTDVPGLTRNDMLRLLGNGVVRQQCAYAWQLLAGISNPRHLNMKETK